MLSVAGDMSLNLRGRGGSVRALMAGLNGNAELITGQGSIKGRITDWLAADLVERFEGELLRGVADYHESSPIRPGIPRRTLAAVLPQNVAAGPFELQLPNR